MSSQQLDTQQNQKGENEPLPTLETWLKENRLEKKFKSHLEEYDVIIEDLLKYDEDEIKLIGNIKMCHLSHTPIFTLHY